MHDIHVMRTHQQLESSKKGTDCVYDQRRERDHHQLSNCVQVKVKDSLVANLLIYPHEQMTAHVVLVYETRGKFLRIHQMRGESEFPSDKRSNYVNMCSSL